MTEQKEEIFSADQRCQRAFQEAVNWIIDHGSSNRLEINPDNGRHARFEVYDGYIMGTIEVSSPGYWHLRFCLSPEGPCFYEEKRHERTPVIDEDVPVALRLESKDFSKWDPEKKAKAAEKILDRMKWELEMTGILPKR